MLAGPLSEVFAPDVTTALARCRGCGQTAALAEVVVYGPEPGTVARCPGCAAVLLRLTRDSRTIWLDIGGIAALRIPIASDAETPVVESTR
jgi:hypothetical protein